MSNRNAFERNCNNFDLIRLIAAYMVIWAHSYAISPKDGKTELLIRLTGITHAGEIAVFIFFFFSGAFIFKSMESSKTEFDFLVKRFFRIVPALVVCVLLVAAMGMLFTTLSISDYLKDHQVHKYITHNIKLVWNEHFLPGVFENHPNKGVNGSLWSITLEARLYLTIFIVGLLGVFRERYTASVVIVLLLVWVFISPASVPLLGSDKQLMGLEVFPQYTVTFLLGGLVYYNSTYFKVDTAAIVVLGVAMALSRNTMLFKSAIMVFSIGLAYYIGTSKLAMKIHLPADFSYGIYLYGWPAGQLAYELFPNAGPEGNTLIAFVVATILAVGSWYLIEKPSLNLARRITGRTRLSKENVVELRASSN